MMLVFPLKRFFRLVLEEVALLGMACLSHKLSLLKEDVTSFRHISIIAGYMARCFMRLLISWFLRFFWC